MYILAEKQPRSDLFYICKDPDVDIIESKVKPSGLNLYDAGHNSPYLIYGFGFDEATLPKNEALDIFKRKIIEQWEYDRSVYFEQIASAIEKAKQWKLTEYELSSD